jgi:hypothetical protein
VKDDLELSCAIFVGIDPLDSVGVKSSPGSSGVKANGILSQSGLECILDILMKALDPEQELA